jgi:hypothetical protein
VVVVVVVVYATSSVVSFLATRLRQVSTAIDRSGLGLRSTLLITEDGCSDAWLDSYRHGFTWQTTLLSEVSVTQCHTPATQSFSTISRYERILPNTVAGGLLSDIYCLGTAPSMFRVVALNQSTRPATYQSFS